MRWFWALALIQVSATAFAEPGLPLVEQFKNDVRGIIQTMTVPAPAAIALAARGKYRKDRATQEFAASSLEDFLMNPGTTSLAATKDVPLTENAPSSLPRSALHVTSRDP